MRGSRGTGHAVTVLRKRWDPRRLEYVADYRCGACGGTFCRRFRDKYPRRCPRCLEPLNEVNGKVGDGAWRR